jgi:glycosyltransferase involved in cell wall biosynthesis
MVKKFIQVVPFYPLPIPQTFKEDYFMWPAVMMKAKGFVCEFVTLQNNQKAFETVNGFPVKRFSNPLKLILYVLKQDALIHAHLRPFLPSLLTGLLPKKKLLTPFTYELGSNFFIKQVSLFLMKRFNKIIPISPYEADVYLRHGFKKEKIEWIPLAIDYSLYSGAKKDAKLARKFNLNKNEFTIITVANFRYFKRIDVLLKAFKELKKSIRKSKLVLVGEDCLAKENKPTIIEMIKELKLKDVVLTGYQPADVISKLFAHSDVFVNTSSVESQCIAAYEAAASNLPLCLSDIGSFTYVFKEHALYHKYTDHNQLASNLNLYYKDQKLAKRNASYVKKLVKTWDYGVVKKKLWKTYSEVLSK